MEGCCSGAEAIARTDPVRNEKKKVDNFRKSSARGRTEGARWISLKPAQGAKPDKGEKHSETEAYSRRQRSRRNHRRGLARSRHKGGNNRPDLLWAHLGQLTGRALAEKKKIRFKSRKSIVTSSAAFVRERRIGRTVLSLKAEGGTCGDPLFSIREGEPEFWAAGRSG